MRLIRTQDGRRIVLDHLSLWRVEEGSVTGIISGVPEAIQIATGLDPKYAKWIGRMMDDAALSNDNKLLDLPQILKDFEAGAYLSEDLRSDKP